LDVHKKVIVACVRILDSKDGTVQSTLKQFGTMTADLRGLCQWLVEFKVTHVAMESTRVYWQPVFNLLEGHFTTWLINAQHIKKVPGRKTDMKEAEWIAQLLQCGLLRPSFVPDRQQRELRDLTRQQSKLVQQRNAVQNRIEKVLETANIKLGSVASDVLGASGRKMIEALLQGEQDVTVLAELAQRKLREKIPQLERALEGELTEHHRFLLCRLLDQYDFLEKEIGQRSVGGGRAPLVSCRRRTTRCHCGSGRARGQSASGGNRHRHESVSHPQTLYLVGRPVSGQP
jgi:transposase